jgi:hypothetical protein
MRLGGRVTWNCRWWGLSKPQGRLTIGLQVANLPHFSAFGNNQRDIVVLLVRAELAHFIDDRCNRRLCGLVPMAPQGIDQALVSEFLSRIVERFGDAVGVEYEGVSRAEQAFVDQAIPCLEKAQQGARGIEPFQSAIAP